jgi:hypothetical protein
LQTLLVYSVGKKTDKKAPDMFTSTDFVLQQNYNSQGREDEMFAHNLFDRVLNKAKIRRLGIIFGQKNRMSHLAERLSGKAVVGQHELGTRAVEIHKIVGSESRGDDFDSKFQPTGDRMRDRWVRVARARFNAAILPPVDLLQVGNEFYVRDGHHRVSVARALGEVYIEACVTHLDINEMDISR